MSTVLHEIQELERQLRAAELKPDPEFFEHYIDDNAVLANHEGRVYLAKEAVVAAHRPGARPTFTNISESNCEIIAHENAAVVSCRATFKYDHHDQVTMTFIRVWLRQGGAWKLISGCVYK